jgi:hypothetical protein
MADTENSYNIGFDWVNLNTLSGISTGDSFYIQNTALAQDIIVLAVSATEPSIDFKGVNLYQKEVKQVLEGNNATWARLVKIDRDPNEVRTASVNIQSSLPAIGLPVSATQTDGLTNAELRASPVDVTFDNSSIEVSNFPAQQDVSVVNDVTVNKGTGWEVGLTDVELRASDLKVSLDNEIVGVSQSGAWSVEINNQLTDYALASKQLIDNHQVTVSNFPTNQTDALTDAELRASRVNVSLIGEVVAAAQSGSWDVSVNNQPEVVGAWGYSSGTSGTVTLTGGKRVLQITAVALEAAGSFTINGGDVIALPYGSSDKVSTEITIEPQGNLTNPTIVFTGTDSYFVEYVS